MKTKRIILDEKDYLILKEIYSNPSVSIRELSSIVLLKSTSPVFARLVFLEELGLLAPLPSKRQHRSRRLTDKGVELLKRMKLI